MTERTINAERVEQLIDVFGSFDENVRRIEDAVGVKIMNRNNEQPTRGAAQLKRCWRCQPRARRSTNRRCATSSISSTLETRIRSAKWPRTSSA